MKFIFYYAALLTSCFSLNATFGNDPQVADRLIGAIERGYIAGRMTELMVLLRDNKNNPNHCTKEGTTPLLHIAEVKNDPKFRGYQELHYAMMKLLLYYRADPTIENNYGICANTWAKAELEILQQDLDEQLRLQ